MTLTERAAQQVSTAAGMATSGFTVIAALRGVWYKFYGGSHPPDMRLCLPLMRRGRMLEPPKLSLIRLGHLQPVPVGGRPWLITSDPNGFSLGKVHEDRLREDVRHCQKEKFGAHSALADLLSP
jgi:hypothetical protein